MTMQQLQINNFKQYCELAALTDNPSDKSVYENNAHYLYGITTEIYELNYASDIINRDEEIGDLLWYISRYISSNNLDGLYAAVDYYWDNPRNNHYSEAIFTPSINALYSTLAEIMDIEKKWLAYNRERDLVNLELYLRTFVSNLYSLTTKTFKQICETNIHKLRIRYGEKFDSYLAVNRNLVAERSLLEEKLG